MNSTHRKLVVDAARQLADFGYLAVPLFAGRKQLDMSAMGYVPLQLQPRSKRMKHVLFEGVLVGIALGAIRQAHAGQWFENRDVNIGVVTGANGLIALDFDNPAQYERFRQRNPVFAAAAPTAFSPRGAHVYFRTHENLVCSSLYQGMKRGGHIKALGGYLVCAPSILTGTKAYAWREGRSLFECKLPEATLAELGVAQVSPVKSVYDKLLGRGGFHDG